MYIYSVTYDYEISFNDIVFVEVIILFIIFFFKQKTTYDMRISDWSSDVCSSDLSAPGPRGAPAAGPCRPRPRAARRRASTARPAGNPAARQIGRASCWERVCQYG